MFNTRILLVEMELNWYCVVGTGRCGFVSIFKQKGDSLMLKLENMKPYPQLLVRSLYPKQVKGQGKKRLLLGVVFLTRKLEKRLKNPETHILVLVLKITVSTLFLLDYPGLYSTQQVAWSLWSRRKKMFWVWALAECADAPFHYLFNSLWIPQSREEERRPCQGEYHSEQHALKRASSATTADSGTSKLFHNPVKGQERQVERMDDMTRNTLNIRIKRGSF